MLRLPSVCSTSTSIGWRGESGCYVALDGQCPSYWTLTSNETIQAHYLIEGRRMCGSSRCVVSFLLLSLPITTSSLACHTDLESTLSRVATIETNYVVVLSYLPKIAFTSLPCAAQEIKNIINPRWFSCRCLPTA
jgi:hypothetical protein